MQYSRKFFSLDCGKPLGMENRKIPDSALTASSFHRNGLDPRYARLHSATSWSAGINNSSQWLQIGLGMDTAIKLLSQNIISCIGWKLMRFYLALMEETGSHIARITPWKLVNMPSLILNLWRTRSTYINLVNDLNPSHDKFGLSLSTHRSKKMSLWSILLYYPFELQLFPKFAT